MLIAGNDRLGEARRGDLGVVGILSQDLTGIDRPASGPAVVQRGAHHPELIAVWAEGGIARLNHE